MNDWTHDGLALDLAQHRQGNGEAVVCNWSIGSYSSGGRVDVAALKLSWTTRLHTVFEVKVTRSDFLSDVRQKKYGRYLPYCHRLYFAAPAGLLKKSDVPEGCGLVVRSDKGWSGVKAARNREVSDKAWATILQSHVMAANPGPWAGVSRLDRLRQSVHVEIRDLVRIQGDPMHKRLKALLKETEREKRELKNLRDDMLSYVGKFGRYGDGLGSVAEAGTELRTLFRQCRDEAEKKAEHRLRLEAGDRVGITRPGLQSALTRIRTQVEWVEQQIEVSPE